MNITDEAIYLSYSDQPFQYNLFLSASKLFPLGYVDPFFFVFYFLVSLRLLFVSFFPHRLDLLYCCYTQRQSLPSFFFVFSIRQGRESLRIMDFGKCFRSVTHEGKVPGSIRAFRDALHRCSLRVISARKKKEKGTSLDNRHSGRR